MKTKRTADMSTIDLNPQFQRVLDLMGKTHRNVFITGRAGMGKSTLLGYLCGHPDKRSLPPMTT